MRHTVVVNDEGQHSVWPASKPVPEGWLETGHRGSREECLAQIALLWTDPRPLGIRS